jgi:hypothetical protein
MHHVTNGSSFDRLLDRIALEWFHVPGAVDLEMGAQLEEAVSGHEKGPVLDRKNNQGSLVRLEVMCKERQAIRIAFRQAGEADERRVIEGVRVAHRRTERLGEK